MEKLINELKSINYKEGVSYKEEAYNILDLLSKKDLLQIVKLEGMTWVKKSTNKEDLKFKIYDYLVMFRCDSQAIANTDIK